MSPYKPYRNSNHSKQTEESKQTVVLNSISRCCPEAWKSSELHQSTVPVIPGILLPETGHHTEKTLLSLQRIVVRMRGRIVIWVICQKIFLLLRKYEAQRGEFLLSWRTILHFLKVNKQQYLWSLNFFFRKHVTVLVFLGLLRYLETKFLSFRAEKTQF